MLMSPPLQGLSNCVVCNCILNPKGQPFGSCGRCGTSYVEPVKVDAILTRKAEWEKINSKDQAHTTHSQRLMFTYIRSLGGGAPAIGNRMALDKAEQVLMDMCTDPAEIASREWASTMDYKKVYYLPQVGFGDLGATSARREFGLRVVDFQPGDTVKLKKLNGAALYTEAKKVKNTWLWDEGASDDYKGTLIISALENVCETVVWFYGQNYKGDMDTMLKRTVPVKAEDSRPKKEVYRGRAREAH